LVLDDVLSTKVGYIVLAEFADPARFPRWPRWAAPGS